MTDTAPDVAQATDIPEADYDLAEIVDLLDLADVATAMVAGTPGLAAGFRESAARWHERYLALLPSLPDDLTRAAMAGRLHPPQRQKAAESVPRPPYPGCVFARVELPGYRQHTGWILEEFRFGQAAAVVYAPDGTEEACVFIGPGCRVVRVALPVPSRQDSAPAIEAADYRYPGEEARAHAAGCHDETCDGQCLDGDVPF